ncbi:cysteine desulfurase DndA [Geothermobacter hydrogeniphilus]|uniref:cysteine desulfurase n=2 Tax=Geothermobacter hydrogeniphilus TaxID=1969733 RepID=A0A2K2H685_9BACT|nr:cysteine desulfurase DndA [Geothermobacter hydrogeniphilus]
MSSIPVYLDCNATTPIEPSVCDVIRHYVEDEYGNAASRTHIWGTRAKQAVQLAREQIAAVVAARMDEVIFTSGATESDNLAILGLAAHGAETGKKHLITTKIEHKAVLEPLAALEKRGFEVTYLPVDEKGWVSPESVYNALRDDTLAISIMHVNNETGVRQPVREIAELIADSPVFFHVDAAQGFGKDLGTLKIPRIDMMSLSAHKIFGPKGVGALIVRRRGFTRIPLQPVMYGGGHERGLRPGTLPVQLIAGFGEAARLANMNAGSREEKCNVIRQKAVAALVKVGGVINGDSSRVMPHVLNISFPGLDSEAILVALKNKISISNGSACTSHRYEPSHVLTGMGLPESRIKGALRISWCHMTPDVDWDDVGRCIKQLG